MRVSRPCYDKMHRCPGWAGGGTRFAKMNRCEGGSLTGVYDRRAWKWRPIRCPECGVLVLPYVVRWADWRWWGWMRDRWTQQLR
jgi:hypothetical protein